MKTTINDNPNIYQAIVLAAGFGTRLLPLTNYIPKPSMPIVNKPIIHYTLETLSENSISQVTINLHHLPELLKETVLSLNSKLNIDFSYEKKILGTGGALKNNIGNFDASTILLVNGDILFNLDLKKFYHFHKKNNALVSLFLRHDKMAEVYGALFVDKNKRIIQIPPTNTIPEKFADMGMFAGIHLIEPELFNKFPNKKNFCIVRDVYYPLVKQKAPIFAFFCDDYWNDIGTPARYLKANFDYLHQNYNFQNDDSYFYLSENAKIHLNISIGNNSVIGKNCVIGRNSSISNSVLLPLSDVPSNTRLNNIILHPKCIISL